MQGVSHEGTGVSVAVPAIIIFGGIIFLTRQANDFIKNRAKSIVYTYPYFIKFYIEVNMQ